MTRRGRKRMALVLGAVAATVLLAFGAHSIQEARKARFQERKLSEGMAAYKAGDYEGALPGLQHYVRHKGDSAEAVYALADSRRRVPSENDRHIGDAINLARLAVEVSEDKRPALEMLLELYGLVGYVTERLQTAERLLEIDPGHADAMLASIQSLVALGRTDKALETAQAMADALPDNVDAQWALVRLLDMLRRPREEIVSRAAAFASSHPDSLRAVALHAAAMHRFGENVEAASIARRAASLPAESEAAVSEYILLLDSLGMDAEAAEFIARELRNEKLGRQIAIFAADRAWKAGRAADARTYIDPVLPSQDDEVLGWAAFLEADGHGAADPGAALKVLSQRTSAASTFWCEIVAGQQKLRDQDPVGARDHLRSAQAARPESTLAEFLLGRVDESVGDWTSAVARWQSVVTRDQGYRAARLALVATLLRNGRVDDARDHAVRALSARSGLVEIFTLSRAFVAAIEAGRAPAGDFERVIAALENLRGRSGTDHIVLPLLARAYAAVGRTGEAHAAAQAIISGGLVPSAEDTIALTGALRRSNPGLAASILAAAHSASPSDPDLVFFAAFMEAQEGRADEGRRMLEGLVSASEGAARPRAELQLAIYLDRTGDSGARERIAKLAADHPRDARFQVALLESQSAWSDADTVAAAIGRLRAVAGESAPVWKLHESRRILLFERTPANAAKAVQLLADLLRIDGNNPAGLTLMADAMLLLDDRAKAIDYLSRVIDNSPGPALYPTLIGLLHESGRTDDVQRRLRDFMRFTTLPLELRRTRAQLLATHGRLADAERELAAIAADGNPADELQLARIYVRRGDRDRAVAIFDRLLAAPEPAAPAVLAAAEFAALQGDVDRGLTLLQRLPASVAEHERSMHTAMFLDRHGRAAEAEKIYALAAARGTPEAVAALISFYVTHGRYDEAESALTTAVGRFPSHPDLVRLQSVVRLARSQSLPTGVMTDVAALMVTEGDERTRERFLEIMRSWEANPSDRASYVARLRRLTETSPTFYPAWYFLIASLLETGSTTEAAQAARIAARVMPSDPRATRLAVAALSRDNKLAEALEMARQWRGRLLGNTLDADIAIADLAGRLGQPAAGLAALDPWKDRLAAEATEHPERLELYAGLLVDARRLDDAHALLWPVAQTNPRAARAYVRVAARISASPQVRDEWLARVQPLVTADPAARYELAEAWYLAATGGAAPAGSPGEASARLHRVIDLLGEDPQAHADPAKAAFLLGVAHEALGNPGAALRFYRAAVGFAPEDPVAANNFAYLLVTTGGSAQEALPVAQRAVETARAAGFPPQFRASFLDTLGVVLLNLERFEEAEKAFSDALLLTPQNLGLLIGSAEAQARRGDASAAAVTVQRIDSLINSGTEIRPALDARLQTVRTLLGAGAANPG